MSSWHENEAFWIEHGPIMFHAQRWEGTPKEVDEALAMMALAPGARVLDLPCGTGRFAIELARRGFDVTAVDRTQQYLDEAMRRAEAAGVHMRCVLGDMRSFSEPNAYDAAFNMYTSFGYFDDQDEDRRVLANFFASLKPGGKLIMELMGKEVLARVFQARVWRELPDGAHLLNETKICKDWTWVEGRWLLVRDGVVSEHTISHRIYSAAELVGLLREAGFAKCGVFGSLAGMAYDHAAERLVVVAERD